MLQLTAILSSLREKAIRRPQDVPAQLLSATVQSSGTSINLVFSRAVGFGTGGNGGFVPSLSGGAATMTYASGAGSTTLVYTLGRTVVSGETGTIAYTQPGNGVETVANLADVASYSGATITNNSSSSPAAPSGPALAFFDIPSLADERATYDLLGWARTSGDEAFDFIDTGAITSTDVHDDSEADDLWTWDAQSRRGHAAAIVGTFRSRWLAYFKNGNYLADLIADDANRGDITPATSADPFCHGYGVGLITYGFINGDAACITMAESIADVGLTNLFGSTTAPGQSGTVGGRTVTALSASGHNMGVGGGRQMARIGQLIANLAYATGKPKWLTWLKTITDAYMGAANWWDTTDGIGIVAGGAYFCDRNWMAANGQQGTAAYDAGARSNSIYQYGMHAEFLWRSFLVTKRADVRDRLIAFARFMEHYAHNPANTGSGGPFCSSYFGIAPGGGYWHRDVPGSAHYDASIVNILVWGYKLTGDAALLTRARVHLRQGTRWLEGEPGGSGRGPEVPVNEVYDFIDTRRNTGGSIYFTDNKGQLQYCYQVFQNGGSPTTLNSGVPSFISGLAPGAALAISNSRISSAFADFSGRAGDPIAIYAFSGGAYDTKRNRYMRSGGGHNDFNGNGVFGFNLYGSETPTWTLFKPHTTPPSIDNFSSVGPEDAPNGDPASSHTYNQIVYDATADKLVLCGLGSVAGSGGQNVPRFRLLNLTTNAWDTKSAALLSTGVSMFGAAFAYHDIERAIYGRGGGSEGKWFRYDCVAGTLLQLTPSGTGSATPNIHSSVALDPVRQYAIFIGGTVNGSPLDNGSVDMVLLDIASRNGAAITTYGRTLTGFPAALRADGIALEFHPPSGTFVAWKGGNTIYRLIPPSNPFSGTWTFSTVTPSGTPLPSISSNYNRPWSGFRWAPYPNDPSRGVFVMDCAQGSQGAETASLVSIFKPDFGTDGAAPTTFTDTFATAQNPIGAPWTRTATNFQAVRTTGGYAAGAAYTEANDDAYCKLSTSAFQAPGDNYEVVATVRRGSLGLAPSECEILLRLTDTSNAMQCYEVLVNTSGGGELVRINGGGPGGYVEIGATVFTIGGWTGDGDKIRARVTGTNPVVITAWHAPANNPTNWTQLFTYSDTDSQRKQSGQPGMGFYQHAADGNLLNSGWLDFTVTAI